MKRCNKRKFRDEVAARLALASILRADKTNREQTEQRAYKCNVCHKFHLTHLKEWSAA